MKYYAPAATVKKLFLASRSMSLSNDHRPCCHLKGCHWWNMHAKYEVSISYGSKVTANVKVHNRQQYALDHSIRGHNKNAVCGSKICIVS